MGEDDDGFDVGLTEPAKEPLGDTAIEGDVPTSEVSGPNRRGKKRRRLPDRIGNYRVIDRLGVGGMAEVFLAEQSGPAGFTKRVVVKRVLPHLSEDERFVELFLREARLAARLSHPNVVQIYELGEDETDYFLVMEHINGVSLHELAKTAWAMGRSLPMELILSAIADAARGLHHAHEMRDDDGNAIELVHRDISPDNLMISNDGVTKVLDFGIARDAGGKPLTKTGELKGKVPYMAPEQIRQDPIDRRTDLYALGVSLYWLLTGKRPFDGGAEVLTLNAVLNREPDRPSQLNPSIPTMLDELIMSLLAKAPADRPATGEVLHDALKNMLPAGSRITVQFVREMMEARASGLAIPNESPSDILAATPTSSGMMKLATTGNTPMTASAASAVEDEPSLGITIDVEPSGPQAAAPHPVTGQISTVQMQTLRRGRRNAALVAAAFAVGLGAVLAVGIFRQDDPIDDVDPPPVEVSQLGAVAPATAADPGEEEAVNEHPDEGSGAGHAPGADDDDETGADKPGGDKTGDDETTNESAADDGAATGEASGSSADPPSRTRRSTRSSSRHVKVTAPGYVKWLDHRNRVVGRGSGTLTLSRATRSLTAVDGKRGGRISVPVKDGIDFSQLPTGELDVRVFPYAKVFLGSHALGATPVPEVTLPAGSYLLILEKDGNKTKRRVTVHAGRTERVKINLTE